VTLYDLRDPGDLLSPILLAAFDGWVDAGGAATAAAAHVAGDAEVVVTFDADRLYDYRARRPTLEIVDGRLDRLTWPELTVRRRRLGEQDVLILAGPEPDYRWRDLERAAVELRRAPRRRGLGKPGRHPGRGTAHPAGDGAGDRVTAWPAPRRRAGRP
jgi:hypothetical protein